MEEEIKRLTKILKHPATQGEEDMDGFVDENDAYRNTESDS